MERPDSIFAQIPFSYAGAKAASVLSEAETAAAKDKQSVVAIGDHSYTISNGYLVPYYPLGAAGSATRMEQLALDRVSRFFEIAERGLNHPWTAAQIENQKAKFLAAASLPEKQRAGRTLVGAMVQRMGRLAEAILQGDADGIAIEIHYDKSIFLAEFKSYYAFLIVDEQHSPVRYVRLRDPSPQGDRIDHDEALFDLVREIGKPLVMREEMLYAGIIAKIGYAMEAIDETGAALERLVAEPQIANLLAGMRANYPAMPNYATLLREYAALCRARAGFKREDYENIGVVDERIATLKAEFEAQHAALSDMVHANARYQFEIVQDILVHGLALMQDQAMLRYPRNGRLATLQDVVEKKQSSVAWLNAAVDAWCADQAMPPAITSHAS